MGTTNKHGCKLGFGSNGKLITQSSFEINQSHTLVVHQTKNNTSLVEWDTFSNYLSWLIGIFFSIEMFILTKGPPCE